MSELPAHVTAVSDSLADGDPERALTAYEQITQTPITELLDQLATAIENEQYADAETVLNEVADRYNTERSDENETTAQAEALRGAEDTSFERIEELNDYVGTATATSLQRSKLLIQAQALLEAHQNGTDHDSVPASTTVAETTRTTKQQEETYQQAASTTSSTLSSATVPASLIVSNVEIGTETPTVGTEITLSISIKNVGDRAVDGVALDVTGPSALTVSQPTVSIGQVAAQTEVTESLSVTGTSEGSYSISLNVKGDNGTGASDVVGISVTPESSSDENAVDVVAGEDGELDRQEVLGAVRSYINDDSFEIGGLQVSLTRSDVLTIVRQYIRQ